MKWAADDFCKVKEIKIVLLKLFKLWSFLY